MPRADFVSSFVEQRGPGQGSSTPGPLSFTTYRSEGIRTSTTYLSTYRQVWGLPTVLGQAGLQQGREGS